MRNWEEAHGGHNSAKEGWWMLYIYQPWTPAGEGVYNHGYPNVEHVGHVSKTCIPGIWKLVDDLWFDMGICLVLVSASCTMLRYLLSTWTGMLTPKHLLLLCSHAPLNRTLFPLLLSCLLSCTKWDQTMFSATALNDPLKPEVQVCLQAWGGIGAHSMDN